MKRVFAILLVAVLLIGANAHDGALAATEHATVVGGWLLSVQVVASFSATTIASAVTKTGTTVKVLSVSNGVFGGKTPDAGTGQQATSICSPPAAVCATLYRQQH
ncbi:MAG: hypothetical protein ACLUE8_02535 [Lachnospiraceae bacterium]